MNIKVLKQPHLTEKSVRQKDELNQITFMVDTRANKVEIKKAVEKLFKVTVLNVHTISVRGKNKRVGRYQGRRPDWKKALLTLKAEDHIDYFEGA